MNLDTLTSPGGGETACSLRNLLGCHASSFTRTLQTKLCSLGPSSNGLCPVADAGDELVIRTVEARWNSRRVDSVVTTVPLITSSRPRLTHGIVYQPLNSQHTNVVGYELSNMDANNECDSLAGSDSSSDQHFDFGTETPLDLDGLNENNDAIVINHYDGLPVDGIESGCIFGSPTLSDSDDNTEEEDVSAYEKVGGVGGVAGESEANGEAGASVELAHAELTSPARARAQGEFEGECGTCAVPAEAEENAVRNGEDHVLAVVVSEPTERDAKMVRQVIDNLFNGTDHKDGDVLIDAKSNPMVLLDSDGPIVTNNNNLKSEEDLNSLSEDSSSKESSPSKEVPVIEYDDDDDGGCNTRHRVQRSTSLKTGKTPPGTPGGKKIVRFADALGLDLAAVRTFLDEIPNVPPSAFNDLSDVEEPNQASSVKACNISAIPAFVPKPNSLTLVATFTQPGQMPDFIEKIKSQRVCLETACMVDELRVRGVVRVLNMDFHKTVIVRYTIDEWRTYTDLLANYVPNSCDGLSDRFSFSLACAPMLQPGQRLIFALCYRVAGQEFWDSNQARNYVFQCISNSSYTPSIALEPQHESFLPYM